MYFLLMYQGIPRTEDSLWASALFFHHVSKSWGLNSGPQTWRQVLLQEEPSSHPHLYHSLGSLGGFFNKHPGIGYCVKIRDSLYPLSDSCWSYHSFNKPDNHCVVRLEGQRGAQKTRHHAVRMCTATWYAEPGKESPSRLSSCCRLALTLWVLPPRDHVCASLHTCVPYMCCRLPVPAVRPVLSHFALALLQEVSRPFQVVLLFGPSLFFQVSRPSPTLLQSLWSEEQEAGNLVVGMDNPALV